MLCSLVKCHQRHKRGGNHASLQYLHHASIYLYVIHIIGVLKLVLKNIAFYSVLLQVFGVKIGCQAQRRRKYVRPTRPDAGIDRCPFPSLFT